MQPQTDGGWTGAGLPGRPRAALRALDQTHTATSAECRQEADYMRNCCF